MSSLSKMVTNITMEMSGDIKKYMVSAVQGDRATRCVLVKLVNNGEPYMIPDGARAIAVSYTHLTLPTTIRV